MLEDIQSFAGATLGTATAQIVETVIILLFYLHLRKKESWNIPFSISINTKRWHQYSKILIPILICEFVWSLCENVYGVIYGRIGTKACAAMTLINPMVILFMGLITAFILKRPISTVYFTLSTEEAVRLAISFWIFRSRKWMQEL